MAKKSSVKPIGGSNLDFEKKKSWLASAVSIKDSHLGECLLSTNAREDRRLNSILLRLEREYKENLRMQRIQKQNFIRRSYILRHQPLIPSITGHKTFNIEILSNKKSHKNNYPKIIHFPCIQTFNSLESNSLLYKSNKEAFFTYNGIKSCNKHLKEIKTKL